MPVSKTEFLAKVAEILATDPKTLSEGAAFESFEEWGSLAQLSLMVLVEETCGMVLSADRLRACVRVSDLLVLLGDEVSA